MRARGVTHVIECGPGKVLAGMVKRIDADARRRDDLRPGVARRKDAERSCSA